MAKILIVDDDAFNREILRIRLELAQHEVCEADGGDKAMAQALSFKPDLIFLDVMMPHIDGWQICKLLKANPRTKDTPVVMLTACGQETHELRGYESGADEYVTKPWDPQRINGVLEKLLPKGKAA
jgi:DNA-binding response OmpR family regulator